MKLLLIALITLAASQAYAAGPMLSCLAQLPHYDVWRDGNSGGADMLFMTLIEKVEKQSGRKVDIESLRQERIMEPKLKLICGQHKAVYRLDKGK